MGMGVEWRRETARLELHVLAEAAAVLVAQRLGVTKGFEHRVGLQQTVAHSGVAFGARPPAGDERDVLHHALGSLSLASTRLAADDDALVLLIERIVNR